MTNRINFVPESFDHIAFENRLIEEGISYLKSDGVAYRFTQVVSFYFDGNDYPAALAIADSMNLNSMYRIRDAGLYDPNYLNKFRSLFLIIIFIVSIAAILYLKIAG